MSQVNSAGATLTNNITPWSRTPGKPTTGAGIIGPFSSARWQINNKASTPDSTDPGVKKVDTPVEDLSDNFESFVATSEPGHMWPSPVFDAPRVTDSNATSFPVSQAEGSVASNQWSVSPFPGGSNSLLGAPGATGSSGSNVWGVRGSEGPASGMPRAITGQQLMHTPNTLGADPSRRFQPGGAWPLATDAPELLSDDRSALSLSLSKLSVNNAVPQGSCFQPIPDYDSQLAPSPNVAPGSKPVDPGIDTNSSHKSGKKLSLESAEVDALFASDPEEAIRTVVNTTEPWGLHPVDQSTPWDLSELAGETSHSGTTCASPTVGDGVSGAAGSSQGRAPGLFESQNTVTGVAHARRIGPSTGSGSGGSALRADLESNVWPSEPPNGTGIWESHYESLGERTARWQPNSASGLGQSGAFGSQPSVAQPPHPHHPGFLTGQPGQPGSRAPLNQLSSSSGADGAQLFRGFGRPAPGLFPVGTGAGAAGLGAKPVLGAAASTHPLGSASMHAVPGSAGPAQRGFPLNTSPGLGPSGSWSFQGGPGSADASLAGAMTASNKGRWPNASGFGRLSGKPTHNAPHMLSNQGGNNMRWPPIGGGNNNNSNNSNNPHVPTGWPMSDPRRPSLMQSAGAGGPGGGWSNDANFFGQPHPILSPPSRLNQPDFPSPLVLSQPRLGGAGSSGLATGQAFRPPPTGGGAPPHSAFYPAFPPSCSVTAASASASSATAQRLFLSPQQHSHQLQQQSVLRANAMRQLINLGFPEEEVQAIFSDINTNVERALMDLRDRTCHPGLDEIIKSFTNSGLMHLGAGMDDSLCGDMGRADLMSGAPGARPMTLRMAQHNTSESQLSKSALQGPNTPADNLELSLHMLQQRETQILQTIMQLHSKHQELNQKLTQIRSPNMPFATHPVLQELQLQAFQVAQQIDAQHAQLKHVRSQVGMLKQISVTSTSSGSQQLPHGANSHNNPVCTASANTGSVTPTSAFNLLTSPAPAWPSAASGIPTCGGGGSLDTDSNLLDPSLHLQEPQGLKLGSGSFLWESGPWSGSSGPRSAVAGVSSSSDTTGCSNAVSSSSADRRWPSTASSNATTYPNRLPFGNYSNFSPLVDPIWAELGDGKLGGTGGAASSSLLSSVATDSVDPFTDANLNRTVGSRSWLLVHNIPPHVSVGTLKAAVSNGLSNYYQEQQGTDAQQQQQQFDFELHPNMSARWVLLGFATPAECSAVHEYLDNAGHGGQPNGAIKTITPAEALLRLQDIQSLASRIKGLGSESTGGNQCPSSQPVSVLNYVNPVSGSADLGAGNPESSSANLHPGDKS